MNLRTPIRLALALLALALSAAADNHPRPERPAAPSRSEAPQVPAARLEEEKSGTLPLREGQLVRLVTDAGHVHIQTREAAGPAELRYRVRMETVRGLPDAELLLRQFTLSARATPAGPLLEGRMPGREFRGRLWVNFEIEVPQQVSIEVATNAGNIQVGDVVGRVTLTTVGGNISLGSVGGIARLDTRGGHITVQNASGDLTALTAGGHITTGDIGGDARLESSGGHIRAGRIAGVSRIETGGGNIFVERAARRIAVTTAGGRIDLGEISGVVQARTGGGGIRVLRVAGPTELESGGGGIYLSHIQGPVRALAEAGGITAWFASEGALAGSSELECRQGDLMVYLPRERPLTIQASIETSGEHRIEADPEIKLRLRPVVAVAGRASRAVQAEAAVQGGGEVIRLHCVAGNITLRFADTVNFLERQLQQQFEQLDLQREVQFRVLERFNQQQMRRLTEQLERTREQLERVRPSAPPGFFERFLASRVRVPPEEQSRRLAHRVLPAYPEAAREAQVQGRVRLELRIGRDGAVEDVKVLFGHPLLAEAARAAVSQWRYEPVVINEKAVPVITTVDVEFKLN